MNNIIKQNFYTTNYITLCSMYLKNYKKFNDIEEKDLKDYNPGHLGSSLGINFLLSNLNYFIKEKNLKSKTVIGTGHSGISLLSNLWLNGTLEDYYKEYSGTKEGLDNLINDFGTKIRSEINPEYPGIIYDGGELGYSLAHAYGYAIDSEIDLVPCIIGDGEAETGTLSASWYLNKMLETKSKVLPIINLNNFKMGSASYLSKLSKEELNNYFKSLGYEVMIIDVKEYDNLEDIINITQNTLNKCLNIKSPLIIFKSPKGWTIPDLNNFKVENETSSHKNPLINIEKKEKKEILKKYLEKYYYQIFNENKLKEEFKEYFKIETNLDKPKEINIPSHTNDVEKKTNIEYAEKYLLEYLKENNMLAFSPDEIYSNKLGKIDKYCFEMLNEQVLEGLLEGYIEAGNSSLFIGYEGFMPLINSMISQRYKYLSQKDKTSFNIKKHSLNYILTSTCWENTYSHQNPAFVNDLLMKDDEYYNVLFPKDGDSLISCLKESLESKDKINVITISKRGKEHYKNSENINIEVIHDVVNPDIILAATGDYMLTHIRDLAKKLKEEKPNIKIKIVYITNPKILDISSKKALTEEEFKNIFNSNNIIYLYNGYSHIIKSMLYERNKNFKVLGYNDKVSGFGGINENIENNGISLENLANICYDEINKNSKVLKLTNN